jgi:hypothetical protein
VTSDWEIAVTARRRDKAVLFSHGQWLAGHIPGVEAWLLDNEGHGTLRVRAETTKTQRAVPYSAPAGSLLQALSPATAMAVVAGGLAVIAIAATSAPVIRRAGTGGIGAAGALA